MYYRVFEVDEALERELLAVREAREAVPALIEALAQQGFRMAEADAAPLAETILGKLRDANGACKLLRGFDVRTREDGSSWLVRYQYEYLGVTLKMDDVEDRDITGQKIVSVGIYGRRESEEADVVIPQSVTSIGQYCFLERAGIRWIVIPEGVEKITRLTCACCKDLEEVVLPDSLTSIEACAFACCPKLTTIRLPRQLAIIGPLAFCGCGRLERLALPDTVNELGYGAFANCVALAELQVPATLAIPAEKHVFYGCDALDASAVQLGRLALPVKTVLDELQYAVESYAYLYLNDVNLQYIFAIQAIDEPEASHLGKTVSDDRLERDIRAYFEHSNWVVLDDRVDLKALREREGTEFMQAAVVDTLRSLGAVVVGDTDEGYAYYAEEYDCIDLISLRFLRIEERWYTMTFEWSD